jgi:hypothetical protein
MAVERWWFKRNIETYISLAKSDDLYCPKDRGSVEKGTEVNLTGLSLKYKL